jgi:hypothetical protein
MLNGFFVRQKKGISMYFVELTAETERKMREALLQGEYQLVHDLWMDWHLARLDRLAPAMGSLPEQQWMRLDEMQRTANRKLLDGSARGKK